MQAPRAKVMVATLVTLTVMLVLPRIQSSQRVVAARKIEEERLARS